MGDSLEYSDVVQEIRGAMNTGRLKLQTSNLIFKNLKTGKLDHLQSSDIEKTNWLFRARGHCLKVMLKNGHIHRFDGFKEGDFEKLSSFISKNYGMELTKVDLSVRGWNWGVANFIGDALQFDVHDKPAFEIPLNNVSHSTIAKNEVALEFHPNDDAAVSLMELRFHIASGEGADEAVDDFHNNIMRSADIIQATGESMATFTEVQCLTPRGRYDIKIYPAFLQLHGKTFDYKIPYTSVLRLFLLPHKDGRQMFFVVSLDPPIKQGNTRYPFLILLFNKEEEMSLDLDLSEKDIEKKYDGKLAKEMNGPLFEVISRVMKAVVNRKITVPGSFIGHSGTHAIPCSYKAATGFMYPLERGFMFVHKPPIHIRFDEVACVNFARSVGATTRSFDFEIETKAGSVHTFSNIEKDEYTKLYDFVSNKSLRVKNIDGKEKKDTYADDLIDSDDEGSEHDVYLERMKAEGKEKDEDDEDEDEDESTDEDFVPKEIDEIPEEYDTDAMSSSDAEGGSGSDEKKKKRKRPKTQTIKEPGSRKTKKGKAKKDKNAPKRAQSAYFLWLNDHREEIKKKYPGISVTDVSKKAGEMWGKVSDKSKWEAKAKEEKKKYEIVMKEYKERKQNESASDEETEEHKKASRSTAKSSKSPKKSTDTKAGSGGGFKSKEYISSSGSSDEDKPKKKKAKKEGKSEKKKKSEEEDEGSESEVGELPSDEEILSSPEASSNEGSGKAESEEDDED